MADEQFEADLPENTDNRPRPDDGDQPDDDVQAKGVIRVDLVED